MDSSKFKEFLLFHEISVFSQYNDFRPVHFIKYLVFLQLHQSGRFHFLLQNVRSLNLGEFIIFNFVYIINQFGRVHSKIISFSSFRRFEIGRVYLIQFEFSMNLDHSISFWSANFALDFCLCPSRYSGISISSIWTSPLTQNVTYNFTIWLLLGWTLNP